MAPHSTKVRGTLSNPKTISAKKSNTPPPQIADPISLQDATSESAPPVSTSSTSETPKRGHEHGSKSASESSRKELPHSKKVRGTLGHEGGNEVEGAMLGDPVSLKTEGRESGVDDGVGGGEDGAEEAARKRGEYQEKRESKL